MAGLFFVSWLLRVGDDEHYPTGASLTLAVIAVVLAVFTAWLGGELVYRLGVGVDKGAHVDAPNSLRSREATEIDLRHRPTRAQPQGTLAEDPTDQPIPGR